MLLKWNNRFLNRFLSSGEHLVWHSFTHVLIPWLFLNQNPLPDSFSCLAGEIFGLPLPTRLCFSNATVLFDVQIFTVPRAQSLHKEGGIQLCKTQLLVYWKRTPDSILLQNKSRATLVMLLPWCRTYSHMSTWICKYEAHRTNEVSVRFVQITILQHSILHWEPRNQSSELYRGFCSCAQVHTAADAPAVTLWSGAEQRGGRSLLMLCREEQTLITGDQLCQPEATLITITASPSCGTDLSLKYNTPWLHLAIPAMSRWKHASMFKVIE